MSTTRTVTTETSEYDPNGNLIKHVVETITETTESATYPSLPYWWQTPTTSTTSKSFKTWTARHSRDANGRFIPPAD
jgi:hypothetical protein